MKPETHSILTGNTILGTKGGVVGWNGADAGWFPQILRYERLDAGQGNLARMDGSTEQTDDVGLAAAAQNSMAVAKAGLTNGKPNFNTMRMRK